MMRCSLLRVALTFALSAALAAQASPEKKPSFEVASIKASDPNPDNPMFIGMSADGAMVTYTNITLRDCIRGAYRVRDFQIVGPDWMTKARFEINARLPPGVYADQIPEMLLALLVERFKLEIRREEDIAPALSSLTGPRLALYVVGDTLTRTNARRISTIALAARLPTMHENRDQVEAGGLMSYAANSTEQYQRAADYVDKILRGTKPADLPVEQPTKFDFVINLTTAKVLTLTIPDKLLALADEVIE